MKSTSLILLLVILTSKTTFSQETTSPYELNKKNELLYSGAGLLFSATGFILRQNASPLTVEEVNQLDANSLNSFDRSAVNNHSDNARKLSDHLRNIGLLLPFTFALPKRTRKDFLTIGLMSLETLLLTNSVTSIFKNTTYRVRPFAYNEEVSIELKTTVQARLSFFSGHTSNYAALSFFSAKVISDYTENKKVRLIAFSTAAISSSYMGYLRVKAGKHFKTDVIAGNIVGAVIGVAIPHLHKKRETERKFSLTPVYYGENMGLNLTWNLAHQKKTNLFH